MFSGAMAGLTIDDMSVSTDLKGKDIPVIYITAKASDWLAQS